MKCASGACQISCLPDYKFYNGEAALTLVCDNGRWLVRNFDTNDIPACERNYLDYQASSVFDQLMHNFFSLTSAAVCLPACKNNGICIAPGQCKCPQNFMGPTCQFEKKVSETEAFWKQILDYNSMEFSALPFITSARRKRKTELYTIVRIYINWFITELCSINFPSIFPEHVA